MVSRGTVGIAYLALGAAGSYVGRAASVGQAGRPRLQRHLKSKGVWLNWAKSRNCCHHSAAPIPERS